MDRHELLGLMKEWIEGYLHAMIRAMLTPMRVRTKGDPTDYTAILTRGVPKGAPSSPVLFNMYIDRLAMYAEVTACILRGEGAVVMMADDFLQQERSQAQLQQLLDAAARWKGQVDAKWSVGK